MIQVRVWTPDAGLKVGGPELLAVPGKKWIDVSSPTAGELESLAPRYGLHRLAIEDCLHIDVRPKLEAYDSHHFLVLQSYTHDAQLELTMHELHFFVAPDTLITVHQEQHEALGTVVRRVEEEPHNTLARGADVVAALVAEAFIARFSLLLEDFGEAVEDLEDLLLTEADRPALERTFELKRKLVTLQRVMGPQRDVLDPLAAGEVDEVSSLARPYYRRTADLLARQVARLDALRELLSNARDAFLTLSANRANDVTKRLTIYASIFLPLNLLVGFFGQNFSPLQSEALFWVMLALLVGVPLGMLGWYRRLGWL